MPTEVDRGKLATSPEVVDRRWPESEQRRDLLLGQEVGARKRSIAPWPLGGGRGSRTLRLADHRRAYATCRLRHRFPYSPLALGCASRDKGKPPPRRSGGGGDAGKQAAIKENIAYLRENDLRPW